MFVGDNPIHINAKKGDIAEIVLMPGDPLRARYIAENFLENAKEVCNLRNMLGFTGFYKGIRVSVVGSGMGMPSMGIYSWELYHYFNVKKIIRIGTCGAYNPSLKIDGFQIYDVLSGELEILGEVDGVGEYVINPNNIRIAAIYRIPLFS